MLACGLVLAFAALVEPPEALAQRGTVEGTVSLDGKPVNKAVIRFENLGKAGKPIEAKTNKKGRFNRYFIPIGRYKVSVFIDNDESLGKRRLTSAAPGPIAWEERIPASFLPSLCAPPKEEREGAIRPPTPKLNQEFQRGRDMFKKKNFTMAAQAFQKAAAMDPDQHVIHAFLGDTYRQMRKYDQAVDSYQKALTALAKKKPNPNSEVAYRTSLAVALAIGGKEKEAYAAVEKISELAPKQLSRTYFRIAAAYAHNGQTKGGSRNLPGSHWQGRSQ